jgi:opacity protein-like surface antigen
VRKYLLAAAAAAAFATPAAARDHGGYVGVEGGLLFPTSSNLRLSTDSITSYGYYICYYETTCALKTHYKTGYDVDVVGGYDFGMFRLEGELGYKRAKHDKYSVPGDGTNVSVDADGRTSSWSAMVNGLVDFGGDKGLNFSIGGGVGYAHTKYRFSTDDDFFDPSFNATSTSIKGSKFAWQLLAEARLPVSAQLDVGLKYRYFDGGRIKDEFADGDGTTTISTRLRSHSILASLIYNFAPPPPPPPPPPAAAPPPPATQTCPDGSVIPATEACPAPPPPPPPPPPPEQRGERGQ